MRKISIAFATFLLISCNKAELDLKKVYNQKANELIIQTVLKANCNCMLEVPSESFIIFDSLENSPKYFSEMKGAVMKKLNLDNEADLTGSIKVSEDFRLDKIKIKEEGVTIVNENELFNLQTKTDLELRNKCKGGIIIIHKPIFNRAFNKAILKFDFAYTHISNRPLLYELKNGKWVVKN